MADVTVIGAGVAGLCAAYALAKAGLRPRLIDRHGAPGPHGCSWWAGGMLAPFCEGAVAEPAIVAHGQTAAAFWAEVTQVTTGGTLVLALVQSGSLYGFAMRILQNPQMLSGLLPNALTQGFSLVAALRTAWLARR